MIPVLSCMQLAASITGTGSGEEKTFPDEGSEKDVTGASGTDNLDGPLKAEINEHTDSQNNNQKEALEDVEETEDQSEVDNKSREENSNSFGTCVDEGQQVNDFKQQDKTESANVVNKVSDTPDIDADRGEVNTSENIEKLIDVKEEEVPDDGEINCEDHSKGNKNIQENYITEQVIKPKKTSLSTFLSRSYFDEDTILKFGSVDIADDAHLQLEILQESTKGKSWDDELKESFETHQTGVQVEEEDSDLEYIEENHLGKDYKSDTDLLSQETKENAKKLNEQVDDVKELDENADEKIVKDCKQENNCQNHDSENEENTYKLNGTTIVNEQIVTEKCENLHGASILVETTDIVDQIQIETEHPQIVESSDEIDGIGETTDDNSVSVNEEINCESKAQINNSDYDADTSDSESENIQNPNKVNNANLSDSETERIERTNEVKAALLSCLKYKRETFEKVDSTNSEKDMSEQFESVRQETFDTYSAKDNIKPPELDVNVKDNIEISENHLVELDKDKDRTENLKMPETREGMDGCVSPSMMFASCRYRWERSIFTQSQSVVFVTLNKKDIEPIQMEWSESSRCFYSDEIKIPVGGYIGNLVIDGTFYPVEDIVIKHYTFEVDIYLKDDILQDEENSSGVTKAEEFIKQKQQTSSQEPGKHNTDITYTPNRATGYTYSAPRAKMESEATDQAKTEGGINVTSKYEELLRSQMTQNKGALNENDLDTGAPDLGGRRTPVGEDGDKQYQDGDTASQKSSERGDNLGSVQNSRTVTKYNTTLDDFFEQRSNHSNGSIQNGLDGLERTTPPAVIDDVLGNGHSRTPIYSTESPVYSKHSSAHSSARQTPTATETFEQGRPESVGSTHSANSLSKQVLDDLVSDALGRPRAIRSFPSPEPTREGSRPSSTPTRPESVGSAHSENSISKRGINDIIEDSLNVTKTPPPSRETSIIGSRMRTPPPEEQIDDVLNPADRHSPIRRDFLAGSPSISNHSGKSSRSSHSSAHSSAHSSIHNSAHSSVHNSAHSSAYSSQRQTPQRDIISNSLKASQEKLYSSFGAGSNTSSRPQSLTSEQELTQYYENLADTKTGSNTDLPGSVGPRTGSAASLPAIGSQQRYTPDKRSMTPDNHIRVPVVGSVNKPLLPSRTPPRTPVSNASSRTVTPMNADTDNEIRYREQVKDLEITISNLRTLLSSRENEVTELKDQFSEVRKINDKLQGDLDRHRARASPGPQIAELERKLHEVCTEKESLNVEVLRLKEDLKQKSEPGLNSYNPNSPSALQRKIDELNSQIQDLLEAHDAASEEIHAAERKVKELAGENETLRVTQSERVRDTEDENRHLKLEIQRLKEGHGSHSDATDYRYKIELQQVKEDNRNLRERNYQLHDDNIRVKEELSELRKTIEYMDKRVQKKDDRQTEKARQFDAYERSATETDIILKSSYQSDLSYSRLSDPVSDRRTDRDRESYTLSRSNYDLQRTEPLRDDREYKEERFTKSEANRYESYRTGPDGGSSDKLLTSLGYSRPLTPERPSALGPPKRESQLMPKSQERVDLSRTFERSDIDFNRGRRERSRTTSGEIDLRTSLAAYHGDLSKTTPALSGRSRAIYNEISDQRSKSKSHIEGANNANICESGDQNDSYPKTESINNPSNHSNQAHTSQVFMNRFVPKNSKTEVEETDTDTRRLHLAEKVDPAYGRREAKVTHQREALEKQMELLEKQAEKQALLASLPIVTKSGYCDDGNTSDTPTDILVSTAPVEKIASASWGKGRQRRGSVGSDTSNSSFSDIDEQITASVRKRSKSADGREILRRMGPTGSSGKENAGLTRTLSPAPSAGLRSLTLRPIATQHNKSALSLSSSLNSLTQGLRPFAPRSAQDLQINDVIKFSRQGGKLSQGTIKFIGHLPGRGDIYLGVELDKEDGKHDGVFEGIRYFKCKPSKGVFVAYNKVVMAWTSY